MTTDQQFFRNARRVDLFVIDGQNDFLASGNEPDNWPWPAGKPTIGALSVTGADQEALNVEAILRELADPVDKRRHRIAKIHASLDSHHKKDGSHNTSWKDRLGNVANPFQLVLEQNVLNQEFVPTFAGGVWEGKPISALDWAAKYTHALAENGRNALVLWPEHCKIGTWGQCVYKPLMDAYDEWVDRTGGWIDWITKGQWPFTEHYSALVADVPDPTRPETQMNADVVNDAMGADIVVWTGWAGSHCLKWTGLDGVNFFEPTEDEKQRGKQNEFIRKCVFVEDASAEVPNPPATPENPNPPNFSQWRLDFLDEMANRGARVMKHQDLIAALKAA